MDHNAEKDNEVEILKALSHQDFMNVGIDQVAYIKPHENSVAGKEHYAVHAADGSRISVMDSYDMALETIRINDLFPVTVH
ncbi:MAG: DUF1150 family protein [Pseudomonadota bacterium]